MRLLILSSASSRKCLTCWANRRAVIWLRLWMCFPRSRVPACDLANPITDLTLDCWGRFTQKGMKAAAFSPALCVGRQCSPTLLIHGEADTTVSPEHSTCYYAAMQDAGIPCDLLFLKDTTHAFLLAEYYKDTLACETAIDWILKMTLVED